MSTSPIVNNFALIGAGLIGGSFALALKQAGVVGRVVGFDTDRANLELALKLGVIDQAAESLADAVSTSQVVFIAVPVRSVASVVAELAAFLAPGTVVTDGGSVKEELVQHCEPLIPSG